MKNTFLLICIAVIFSGCMATHSGLTTNSNQHVTDVVLSKKNFKVIASVKGEAEASYFLGMGGISKNGLIQEAKTDMFSKADIIGGAKAVINETVEIKNTMYLGIITKKKVTVSANIIEFTE
jgi:hypothetical protein